MIFLCSTQNYQDQSWKPCSTVTPIKKLTFHAGNMCRTWGSTSPGNGPQYQVGKTGYMSKETGLGQLWTRILNNRMEQKDNGRRKWQSDKLRPKMGLINGEMASRREGPLLGEPFGLEVFWQNLLELPLK